MIEKLERPTSINWDNDTSSCIQRHKIIADLFNKINEIIDTIYDMQLAISNLDPDSDWYDDNHIAKTSAENSQDEFAEQRKWIGKLCWFWDEDRDDAFCDVLGYIFESSRYPYAQTDSSDGYKHCEPVKPDDNIIYKGE